MKNKKKIENYKTIDINIITRNLIIEHAKKEKLANFLYSLKQADTLKYILPEFIPTVDFPGGKHHCNQPVFDHLLAALNAVKDKSLDLQLAALFHDIGKPAVAIKDKKDDYRFHSHEIASTTIAFNCLQRLKFNKKTIYKVATLVRYHMFRFDLSVTNEKTIRKWLFYVGKNNWEDLFTLRIADRVGNLAKQHKPSLPKESLKLYKLVKQLTLSKKAIFEEDLKIDRKKIKNINKTKVSTEEVLLNLIGMTNNCPSKNCKCFLEEYIKRVYG